MHPWKIYIWAFSLLLLLSAIGRLVLFFKRRDLVSPLDLTEAVIGLIAVPALFGFAYQRAYGPNSLWMVLCILMVGLSVYQFFTPKMKKLYAKGWFVSTGVIVLQIVLGSPALWALIRYSFFEPSLWAS